MLENTSDPKYLRRVSVNREDQEFSVFCSVPAEQSCPCFGENAIIVVIVGYSLLCYPRENYYFQIISVLNREFGGCKESNRAWVMRMWGELNINWRLGMFVSDRKFMVL